MTSLLQLARKLAQELWARLLLLCGCMWWAKREFRQQGAVVVLMCHRVLDDDDFQRTCSQHEIVVRERTFRRLARHIAESYEPVSLCDCRPGRRGGRLRVAFTFDDGWSDNGTTALPVAREYGIPMSIFICPGLVGSETPFWPEQVTALYRAKSSAATSAEIGEIIETLKTHSPEDRNDVLNKILEGTEVSPDFSRVDSTLSWEEIVDMDRQGVVFGSHTFTHQILTTVPEQTVLREIRESREAIEQTLGKPCDVFAYPNGNWSRETRRILAEEGFRLALTTERGVWTNDSDPLAIPRLSVTEDNLVGLTGRFSRARFEYTMFWKTWLARRKAASTAAPQIRRTPLAATRN